MRDIPVEVHAPASWQLRSTWRRRAVSKSERDADRRVYGFVPRDFRQLRDAFLVGGADVTTRRRRRGESRIDLVFGPTYRADRKATGRIVARVIARYRRRFGPVGPVTVYLRARDGDDRERRRGTSRRGGFVVSLPANRPPGPREALLIAHEAFHLWNGHALVPSPDSSKTTRWFMEGATQYIALKTVRRLGWIGLEGTLEELARSASAYLHNPAAREARASRFDRRRLPYDRGLLLALAFDATLERTSDGEIGLETWFRTMLDPDRGEHVLYTLDDLERALRRVATERSRALELWRQYVERDNRLDPRALFRSIGLHFSPGAPRADLEPVRTREGRPLYRALLPGPNTESGDASSSNRTSTRANPHE